MSYNEKLKSFHKLYTIVGMAPIRTADDTARNDQGRPCTTILCSIPAIISIIASIALFALTVFPDLNYDRILMILFNGYFLFVTMVSLVANVQCLVHKRLHIDMVECISRCHQSFAVYCKTEVNYANMAQFYRIKFCVVYFIWIEMTFVSYLIHMDDRAELIFTTVTVVLECTCSLACMQAILFVDYVGLFIEQMNETFVSTKSYFQSSTVPQLRAENLDRMKRVHLEIWELVQQINEYFGWLFATLFVKYLVDIIYSLYVTFIDFEEFGWNTVKHLESISWLVFSMFCLIFLVNSSQRCTSKSVHLVANVIKYSTCSSCENTSLFLSKQDILTQIRDLPLQIVAGALFNVDRNQLAALIAASCTYIIIFIQFYTAFDGNRSDQKCNSSATNALAD